MAEIVAERRTRDPASGRQDPHPLDDGEEMPAAYPDSWQQTIDIDCDRPAGMSIRCRSVADAVLATIASPPATITQTPSAGVAAHRFHVVLLLEGQGDYHWDKGAAIQRPGDIVLLDMARASRVISPVSSRLIRWSFPEALIAPFLPLSDSPAALHLPARGGLMTVVAQHTHHLAREAGRLEPAVQHSLLSHLCGLLGLAVEAQTMRRPVHRCNYRTFQRQRVLSYIEAHLSDPRCTAKRAARDLGISVRWLHALLEDMEDGFAGLVARRRLEGSLERLGDPASDHLSIAEIAFLSGFNDLSAFYRRFGECFGMTPGQARRAQRQPCGVS